MERPHDRCPLTGDNCPDYCRIACLRLGDELLEHDAALADIQPGLLVKRMGTVG